MRSVRSGLFILLAACATASVARGQMAPQKPEAPVEKWTGKTIMLIGAHADDDALSLGTLAMLQAHGIQVNVVT